MVVAAACLEMHVSYIPVRILFSFRRPVVPNVYIVVAQEGL